MCRARERASGDRAITSEAQMSLVYFQEGLRLVVLYVSVRGKVDEVFTRQRKYPERTEIVSPQLEWFELLSR
jgi:hypothetical protein